MGMRRDGMKLAQWHRGRRVLVPLVGCTATHRDQARAQIWCCSPPPITFPPIYILGGYKIPPGGCTPKGTQEPGRVKHF